MTEFDINSIATNQVSTTDQVFDTLYNAVISVKLMPGTKVSEAEIAKQLGVSRQPVRDAFFRLSNLGLLSIRPQRATLITQISLAAVLNAVFVRIALETECLRIAMSINKNELIDSLSENLSKQKQAIQSSASEFHALDEAFHEIICNAAGHPHVWTLIREQKAHLDRIRYLTLSEERRTVVIEEHERFLAAIQAEDATLAEGELREHISGVTDVAQSIQDKYISYFETT